MAPARQGDRRGRDVLHRARARERADRLLKPGHFPAPAADVGVGGAQLSAHLARRHAERQQPVGIELDPDLAIHAADALHLTDATQALQRARRHVVDEP